MNGVSNMALETVTPAGRGSQPGGGGQTAAAPPCSPTTLPLPPSVLDAATDEQIRQLNRIQIIFARDVTVLQSQAYEAVLKVIDSRDN